LRLTLVSLLLGGILLSTTSLKAENMTRETIDLSVDWRFAQLDEPDLSYPQPQQLKWYPTDALLFPRRGERAYGLWYNREFDVPASFGIGKRLKLQFGGAKYTAEVHLNGTHVGSYGTGFVPFSFDVTDHVKRGQTNEVFVGVGGLPFTLKRQVPNPPRDLDSLQALGPIGLVPAGLLAHEVGLWDGVRLVAYDPVHLSDVFIQTSFRNKDLTAELRLSNDSSSAREVRVSAVVLDGDRQALELPSKSVKLQPDSSSTVVLKKKWPDPRLWSPDDPHLYHLRVTLAEGGTVVDSQIERFGFREFWTDGSYFRLNGVKLKLRGAGTHFFGFRERGWDTKEGAAALLKTLKEKNFNVIRFHAQIWPAHMYEAADEVGILTVPESPMWTRIVRYADIQNPRFWENATAQLRGMVLRDRNHPSVVIWSIENEFLHMVHREEDKFRTIERGIAEIGRSVKSLDPTRPIMYAADLDPEGTADVIGLHYVVEYPNFNLIPGEFYWLDKPIERSPGRGLGLLYPEPWTWDREKPFFITEFAWLPFQTPDHLSGIIGDEIYYGNPSAKHRAAKATIWQMQIEAFRYEELSGMSPWTPFEGGGDVNSASNILFDVCERSYQPLAAFVKEYNKTFYENSPVSRTVTVYNDTLEPKDLEFAWSLQLSGASAPFASGAETLNLPPAGLQHLKIHFRAPSVDRRASAEFQFRLRDGDRVAFEESKAYSILPALDKPVALSGKLALYDSSGQTADLFRSLGIAFEPISPPFDLDPAASPVLVVGKDSLDYSIDVSGPRLSAYIQSGGRLVVLEQERSLYHRLRFLPVRIQTARGTTIAFPRSPSHPVLAGLEDGDLRFWGNRDIVARTSLLEPDSGNFIPIIDCSDGKGLINSLLMEIPWGNGACILSTLDFHSLSAAEPLADMLLTRLLRHAFTYKPPTRSATVLSDSGEFSDALSQLGLNPAPTQDLTHGSPAENLLILSGDAAWDKAASMGQGIREFLENGGSVLAHALTPSHAAVLSDVTGARVALQKSFSPNAGVLHGAPQLDFETQSPVSSGISSRLLSLAPLDTRGRPESASYVIDASQSPAVLPLTEPPLLAVLPVGKGIVILDQVPWEDPRPDAKSKASRYASILLTNLGIRLGVAERKVVNVDITSFCNRGFRDLEAGDGQGGWTDRGRDDMRFFPDPVLGDWIPGMQRPVVEWQRPFAGVPFKIVDPEDNDGRSCIVAGSTDDSVPPAVGPIPVGAAGNALYFLFAVETELDSQTTLGNFHIKMRDGRTASYPIVKDRHASDWRTPPADRYSLATVAWSGPNLIRQENAVYLYSITPGTAFPAVESVTIEAADGATVIVLGITLVQERPLPEAPRNERNRPRRG